MPVFLVAKGIFLFTLHSSGHILSLRHNRMKFFLLSLFVISILGCVIPPEHATFSALPLQTTSIEPSPTPQPLESVYPGTTIDQVFPILSDRSFSGGDDAKKRALIPIQGFEIEVNEFAPITLRRGKSTLLKFKTMSSDGYWSNLVGASHLLGKNSNQIYIVSTGPGAVCCTNYWIVDINNSTPREIFRSEEFGRFRDPMELFDDDGDGIYELVQMDSCFRYFMGDCGTCSPQPRVTFKFDPGTYSYKPAAGIMQDFAKETLVNLENQLAEMASVSKQTEDTQKRHELESIAFDCFVQRLHLGEEEAAWNLFKTYIPKPSKEMMAEIENRLKNCEFYQTLKRSRKIPTKP